MDVNDPDLQAEEMAWLECTQRGAVQVNSGQIAAAGDNWRRACGITERFGKGDPRHAASLNNLAVIARFAGRFEQADRLYDHAIQVWDQVSGWVERIQLAPRARSSLFHMRLEQSHRDHFARWALDEYFKQLPRGAAVTLANRAELYLLNGDRAQAKLLYRQALNRYEITLDAPAHGAEAIRRNLAFLEQAESGETRVNSQCAVWAPALARSFIPHARREGWIIDLPAEFTDEGRLMAGLMWVCLIEQMPATQPG